MWYSALANIYGIKSDWFDGYISSIVFSDTILEIECYLVEDPQGQRKVEPLKQRYSDWHEFQKLSITDALKLRATVLGYKLESVPL